RVVGLPGCEEYAAVRQLEVLGEQREVGGRAAGAELVERYAREPRAVLVIQHQRGILGRLRRAVETVEVTGIHRGDDDAAEAAVGLAEAAADADRPFAVDPALHRFADEQAGMGIGDMDPEILPV